MLEGSKNLSWSFTSPEMFCNLQNIFLWFFKVYWIVWRFKITFLMLRSPGMSFKFSWIAWRFKINFLKFEKSWNVLQASKYFFWFFKVSWIAWRFKRTFLRFEKSWNVLKASKYFLCFLSLLDCLKVQNNFSEVWQVLKCLASFKTIFYDFLKSPGLL